MDCEQSFQVGYGVLMSDLFSLLSLHSPQESLLPVPAQGRKRGHGAAVEDPDES